MFIDAFHRRGRGWARPAYCHFVLLLLSLLGSWRASSDDTQAIQRLSEIAQAEVDAGRASGMSIALIDDQRILFASGFGMADKRRAIPATANTVYRVGSISKLFAAVAAMQLAEKSKLDIDAPAHRYVPEFKPVNPFPDSGDPTLRQLMCHRSGLVREAPVGGYFDESEPSAEATVASLADCVMPHPPNSRTKYSNSGVTVVGRAVEEVSGLSFAEYQQRHILEPLGMSHSAFLLERHLKPHLARGYLNVALTDEGYREIQAPQFEFGILPAGNLYSTVEDLARFASCLFADGRAAGGSILEPATLAEMWKVQLQDATNGFGLGFSMGNFRGLRTFGHTGAVYGFTSQFLALRDHRLAAIVLVNDDLAIGVVRKMTAQALTLLLEGRGILSPATPATEPAAATTNPAAIYGDYESESYWARVEPGPDGGLRMTISRQVFELRPAGDNVYRANGRMAYDAEVRFKPGASADGAVDEFTCLGQTFRRVRTDQVPEVPESWDDFIGSYGPGFIPLIVSVRHGHLYAMTENEFDYRLTPLNRTVFQMPPGLYESEQLIFQRDRSGRVHGVLLANMPLTRRR